MQLEATQVFEWNWSAINEKNQDGERKYKYIINEGSSRSSKTYSMLDCYDIYARSNKDKRLTVWRDTKTDCKKTVLNDLQKHLRNTGRWLLNFVFNKTESILTYNTGSTFEIHGTDDEESVHGLTQDAAWLNEPYKISKDTFDQIDQRTSDFIFIDWNPKKSHWIEDLKKDSRAIVIKSTYKNNPLCPAGQRFKIEAYQPVSMCDAVNTKLLSEQDGKIYDCKENIANLNAEQITEILRCQQNEYKKSADAFKWSVYGLGLKAERPNRIFKWEEISEEGYNAIASAKYIGVDWGAVDPFGIVEVKYYDGNLYVKELNYRSENEWRSMLNETEQAQVMGQEEGFVTWIFNRLGIPYTAYITCDNNRPLKILALREAGWEYALAAAKGSGSILDGIDLLNNLNVYYTTDSTNLKYESENYSRKVDRSGEVLEEAEDLDNHLIDPIRYVATMLKSIGVITKV